MTVRAGPTTAPAAGGTDITGAVAVVITMHVLAGGLLLLVLGRYPGTATASFAGLALAAYTLGVRHAFDADHIAAIDNTTRTLVGQRRRSATVGMWFSLGHSTVVFALATLVAIGAGVVGTLLSDDSGAHRTLALIGLLVSGLFLLAIGVLNLFSLVHTVGLWRRARTGEVGEEELARLQLAGPFTRLLRPLLATVDRPGRMYPVGLLFGLGFDTATETGLLILAGTSAAGGMPWYAILLLPLLFAAGMCLFDTADGILMQRAYRWAFLRPARKLYYNLTVTGLSVAVALGIGGIELISVLHVKAHLADPVTSWISGIDLDQAGFYIVGLFVVVWAASTLLWRRYRPDRPAAATAG